ncbi:hypothetical protein [Acidovorax sp. NCPPB 3576]|uniref:hypothetical protein n=1 Tax=Acidovorax sp. NCPPB 3576 TaxID=2940488 RepID=UPI003FA47374
MVSEAANKHKVSDATIYAWRRNFGQIRSGLDTSEDTIAVMQSKSPNCFPFGPDRG